MISANGGLPAHRYTPQVTQRWPRGSEPASLRNALKRDGNFFGLKYKYDFMRHKKNGMVLGPTSTFLYRGGPELHL